MKLCTLVSAGILVLLLLSVCVLSISGRAADNDKDREPVNTYYKTVGIYPFYNGTKRKNAGVDFSEALLDRLADKFPDVKFVYITPDEANYDDEGEPYPVNGKYAIRLGNEHGVEAIIDGTVLAYKFMAGLSPPPGDYSVPGPDLVLVHAELSVVETANGSEVRLYEHAPKRPKRFPKMGEKYGWKQAIRQVIDYWAGLMSEDGVFYKEKKED